MNSLGRCEPFRAKAHKGIAQSVSYMHVIYVNCVAV